MAMVQAGVELEDGTEIWVTGDVKIYEWHDYEAVATSAVVDDGSQTPYSGDLDTDLIRDALYEAACAQYLDEDSETEDSVWSGSGRENDLRIPSRPWWE